jgi:hypothetical protein
VGAAALLTIRLSGWAMAVNVRRTVEVGAGHVAGASATLRSALEPSIDRRVLGVGTHNGAARPNRTRIGTMLARGVDGRQFWAVRASGPELPVLVLDLRDHEFTRVVAAVADPYAVARDVSARLGDGG